MKKVDKLVINEILKIYNKNCRYINKTFIDENSAKSILNVYSTFHANERAYHLTVVEAQIALNQACYIASYYWMKEGIFPNMEYDLSSFIDSMKENMFIIDSSIKFKKQIYTGTQFNVEINLEKYKKFKNLFLAYVNFDFENHKAFGKLKLVFTT